ncbi:MAG: hypothetical protein LUI14_12580 [Lachnospiraceae bacterium]|nr:hypothetical protein [Lachnospiraceae bacterium]
MEFLDRFKNKKVQNPTYDTKDRYMLEHNILPQFITGENGAATIALINQKEGNFFVEMYQTMNKNEEQYICPYSSHDFKIQRIRLAGGTPGRLALQLQMPVPERVPLCGYVFILHDEHLENRRYITAELSASGHLMLCEWRNGQHLNYGVYSKNTINNALIGLD